AVHVVHPNLTGTNTETSFRNINVFAAGIPTRRSEFAIGIFRYLLYAASIWMHHPNVFAAFTVGQEGNPLSVGRKFRLAVKRHTAVDEFFFAAFDGQGVNVIEQFKRDGFAVRRDIERKPRTFISGEGNFAIGLQGQALFLVFLI